MGVWVSIWLKMEPHLFFSIHNIGKSFDDAVTLRKTLTSYGCHSSIPLHLYSEEKNSNIMSSPCHGLALVTYSYKIEAKNMTATIHSFVYINYLWSCGKIKIVFCSARILCTWHSSHAKTHEMLWNVDWNEKKKIREHRKKHKQKLDEAVVFGNVCFECHCQLWIWIASNSPAQHE